MKSIEELRAEFERELLDNFARYQIGTGYPNTQCVARDLRAPWTDDGAYVLFTLIQEEK